jgi:glycosyltransferase involved in cell wall biosynthesis
MCRALATRGDEVDCVVLSESETGDGEKDGVRVVRLRQRRYRGRSRLRYLLAYVEFLLRATLRVSLLHFRRRYHVVHVNNMPNFIVCAAFLPRLTGARVLLDIHDTMPEQFTERFGTGGLVRRLLAWEERLSARVAHAVICVHRFQRDLLVERGVPADKISIVMNLPDDGIWEASRRPKAEPRENGFLMVFHGTITRDRGVDVAIRALGRLCTHVPAARLRVIGDGDALPALRTLAREVGVVDRVEFSGRRLPVHEVPAIIADADLGLIPAHAEWGLPTKLMEYLTLSVPCIAPRTKLLESFLADGVVRFIEPGNVDELAAAIRELAEDPARREQLARRGREFASRHTWREERERYFEVVDRGEKRRLR